MLGAPPLLRLSVMALACICPFALAAAPPKAPPAVTSKAAPQLDEVVVQGNRTRQATTEIDPQTQQLFKVAGSSLDPLSSLYSLPGVTNGGDFRSAPAIRGSAPEDNAYYIDFIPARYVFHVFGNSIFNENLIHKFDLYPAAFTSQYANATGAVIDVSLRDPRHQKFTTTADWSFLLTGVMVESEINEQQAFYASFRRSLIDQFYDKDDAVDEEQGIAVDQLPVADDYQLKYLWDINPENQLSLVAAGANDKIGATFKQNSNAALLDPDFTGAADLKTGFDSQGIAWNYAPDSDKTHAKTLLTHTTDEDRASYGTGQFVFIEAERLFLREHISQQLTQSHWLTLGAGVEQTDYDIDVNAKIVPCGYNDPDCIPTDAPLIRYRNKMDMRTITSYLQDDWHMTDSLLLTTGVHYMGDDYLDETVTQPRVRLLYTINDAWAVNFAAGRYSQLPQLPEMVDETGNPALGYIDATHYVIGIDNQWQQGWSWHVDTYYKKLDNVVNSISDPTDPNFGKNYSNDASGRAYGLELLVNKKMTDKFYGWLALSLSKTERRDDRTGETRPFDFDRPVILNMVGNYQLDDRWLLGFKWTIQSGLLYTPIVDLRESTTHPGTYVPVYGELNSERLPIYHRLDLRGEYTRPTGFGFWSVFVDVLNAYDQKNIEGYQYSPNGYQIESSTPDGFGDNVPVVAEEGFRFFPSIGFKIQF